MKKIDLKSKDINELEMIFKSLGEKKLLGQRNYLNIFMMNTGTP